MKAQKLLRLGLALFLMTATMASSGVVNISALFDAQEYTRGIAGLASELPNAALPALLEQPAPSSPTTRLSINTMTSRKNTLTR
jgi:hypothetical protein